MTFISGPAPCLRVALVQMTCASGDIDANLEKSLGFIDEAGRSRADLILFPEKALSGYTIDRRQAVAAALPSPTLEGRLKSVVLACANARLTAIIGCIIIEDSNLFIASVVVDGEGIRAVYRKQHLFQTERVIYAAGTEDCKVDASGWSIGLGICFDGSVSAHSARLAGLGCDVYALSALFGSSGGREESRAWLSERAKHSGIFTIMSNHVGPAGPWTGCGSNAAWSPEGLLMDEADNTTEGILIIDLDRRMLGPKTASAV